MRASVALPVTALCLALGLSGCESCGAEAEPETLRVRVDADGPTRPISPWIYGINGVALADRAPFTLIRFGGTRTSTYNWENNASNAGHDPPVNQNDGYLSRSDEPGAAVIAVLDAAQRMGAAALITVPMLGHAAADKRADGDVSRSPNWRQTRFVPSVPRCDEDGPNLDDGRVCQHAFVRFVREAAAARGVEVMFALDNEPGGWPSTQPLFRGESPVRYDELFETSASYAQMIAEEAPGAPIFGPVSFGWPAMNRLAGAPDAGDRFFLEAYLESMRDASQRHGERLLHALDVHWYPVPRVDDVRVSGPGDDPALRALRMQTPRSLYDDEYEEPSFIVDIWLDEPIRLLPRLRELIDETYPGTEIAITEWAYGGAAHPSGAVAVADALGAMGRHGVHVASYWALTNQEHGYAMAAFQMYRAPAEGVSFGDRSLEATSNDLSRVSAWASKRGDDLVLVLVARGERSEEVQLELDGVGDAEARRFVLDGQGPRPREVEPLSFEGGRATIELSPRSVTTLAL